MRSIRLAQPVPPPLPGDVSSYLLAAGWTGGGASDRWATFSRELDGDKLSLEVPQLTGARDYVRVIGMLLEDLARIESRSLEAIVEEMHATGVDVVRLALEGATTRDGGLPVESGPATFQAARDLLLAAACSAVEPRTVFAKRKPDAAMGFLGLARIARAEPGSFILTVEVPVPRQLQGVLFPHDPDPPFARRVVELAARGVAGAVTAAREAEAGAGLEAFRRRAGEGVSANLCEALGDLVESANAEILKTSVAFATHRPANPELPRFSLVTPDLVRVLQEAAREMRAEAIWYGTEVKGPVVKLVSSDVPQGGEVVIQAEVEGRLRYIKLTLGSKEYAQAVDAHRAMKIVQAVGDLGRKTGAWVLDTPKEFAVVDLPESSE